ncbi:MAG TPA: UvrD-helicase domain-containing protein [Solirubrobacteraceae bacterium]|jgi:ATP-dependent exoDNAse (exonuclease V) beta subunit
MQVPHDLPLRALSMATGAGYQVQTLPGMEPDGALEAATGPELTREQEQAVRRRAEPLLVSAAAGSGKTSVLVERFVRAIREDGIAPGRLLAITFTERAAGELRERVRARLLELGDRDAARDTEGAFVGTFHGFCVRVLRAHPLAAGLDPDFTILDEGLAGRLREDAFTTALERFLDGERSDAVDMLAAYGVDRVRGLIQQAFAELRSRGSSSPRLPLPDVGDGADALAADAARTCALLDELLGRFGDAYADLKRGRGAADFDDLELRVLELLRERESVRAAWSERFELLMVDEFQDTNARQLGILEALDRGNLFTVGDELQSIYGFRHADVGLFRARNAELEQSGGSIGLTRNFRSRAPLLDVINTAFAGRFPGYRPLLPADAVAGGEEPPLVELLITSTAGWEEHRQLVEGMASGLPHAQPWRQAEARVLAGRVRALIDAEEARAGDVVVLLRAAGDLEVYERALQLRGLRTLAAVGTFWGHQQIGDLISYLRALANPLDELALYGALASPLAGCSRDCLALLAEAARERGGDAWSTALEADLPLAGEDLQALGGFCSLLARERDGAFERGLSELIERAIEATGYRRHVLALDWGERRLANVHKLLRLARRFEASEGRDLRGFLQHVAYLQQAVKVEPDAPVEGVEPDAVRLMTVHAAKGLEFPVVCVADLGRQPRRQTPDLLVDGERIGLRLVRLDGERSVPSLEYDELCLERRDREAQEEDRILYVAMTRARERLLLSGAVDFERWPSPQQASTPISWLAPALSPQIPALAAEGHAGVHDVEVGDGAGAFVRLTLTAPADAGTTLHSDGPDRPVPPDGQGPPAAARPAVIAHERREVLDGLAATVAGGAGREIATLSYTSLSELERCGYRYYLERVLGLPEARTPGGGRASGGDLDARERGVLVHSLMESLDFERPRAPSVEDVARAADELALRAGEPECRELAALLDTASRTGTAERLAGARGIRREYPFAFSLGPDEPLVTGVIDLLASEPDGACVVVDYKSDRVGPEIDLGALVEREYGIQRLLYALAVLRDGAPAVEVVHWFLERPEEPVRAPFAAAERLELEQRLAEMVARARARGFAVSSRPHRALCLTCPGRAALCSWGESETLRGDPGD